MQAVTKIKRGKSMTNQEIIQVAFQQSAYDCNCKVEDFLSERNVVTLRKQHRGAGERKDESCCDGVYRQVSRPLLF